MTYLRPIRLEELVKYFKANGLDGEDGFVEELAQKMVDKFDILTYSMEQA